MIRLRLAVGLRPERPRALQPYIQNAAQAGAVNPSTAMSCARRSDEEGSRLLLVSAKASTRHSNIHGHMEEVETEAGAALTSRAGCACRHPANPREAEPRSPHVVRGRSVRAPGKHAARRPRNAERSLDSAATVETRNTATGQHLFDPATLALPAKRLSLVNNLYATASAAREAPRYPAGGGRTWLHPRCCMSAPTTVSSL